jgi:hypothetical protein
MSWWWAPFSVLFRIFALETFTILKVIRLWPLRILPCKILSRHGNAIMHWALYIFSGALRHVHASGSTRLKPWMQDLCFQEFLNFQAWLDTFYFWSRSSCFFSLICQTHNFFIISIFWTAVFFVVPGIHYVDLWLLWMVSLYLILGFQGDGYCHRQLQGN